MESIQSNKRIAKNTILLYVRMFFGIVLQFYTVPIVLNVLGLNDYGLYNVVAGIALMFAFVKVSMAACSQRFLSFAIGANDTKLLKKTLDTTISIYIVLSMVLLLVFELIGVWFLNYKMQIPIGREVAANIVYQLSVITFIFSVLSVPFDSVVISHEKFDIFAYISIGESILRLLAVIILQFIQNDHLIVYSVLLFVISIIERGSYITYCRLKFKECQNIQWNFDASIGHTLLTYSGFNIIGSIANILRTQGVNIVMNLFYGTVVNAAHGIAQQIGNVINQFIQSIYMASRPQITKMYAANKIDEMWTLVYQSAKLAFYLLMILSIPLLIEMKEVLTLWLGEIPEFTVGIAKVFIITLLIETSVNQIISVFQAYNKIKYYQLYSSTILLLNVPVAYLILSRGLENPMIVYYIQLFFSGLFAISILVMARAVLHLNVIEYFNKIIIREISTMVISYSVCSLVVTTITPSIFRIFFTIVFSFVLSISIIWTLGLDKAEKRVLKELISNKVKFIYKQ